jgi:MFS family permease
MKEKLIRSIFWTLVGIFIVVVAIMAGISFAPTVKGFLAGGWFLIISGILFFSLGIALLVLAIKKKERNRLGKFLILTGAAAAGIPVSAVLHNVIYGLFIYWFGADFWEKTGLGDEPFFFIMAIIVCPLGFLAGAVGSVVLFFKEEKC